MVDSPHGKGVTFTIRSAPVGYAAEYPILAFSRPNKSRLLPMFIWLILYHLSLTLELTDNAILHNRLTLILRLERGKKIHLQGICQFRRRAEGEVHILMQHLCDIRPRHFHPSRQLRLRNAQFLHPEQNLPQERRSYFVDVHIRGF